MFDFFTRVRKNNSGKIKTVLNKMATKNCGIYFVARGPNSVGKKIMTNLKKRRKRQSEGSRIFESRSFPHRILLFRDN